MKNGMYMAVKIYWTESESGWGQRPDGTTVHKDMDIANKYIADYWKKEKERNPSGDTPSCYVRPDKPEVTPVPVEVFEYLNEVKDSFWIDMNRWWSCGEKYDLPKDIKPHVIKDITEEIKKELTVSPKVEDMSIEDLEKIIAEKKKVLTTVPPKLETPDLEKLERIIEEHMQTVADGSYHEDDDDKQFIFEEAIQAYYGKAIWTWYNKTRK